MSILLQIIENTKVLSDDLKGPIISVAGSGIISIIGFVWNNRSMKKNFKNEILKQRNEVALNKMATMPMKILELLEKIIETNGEDAEIQKEFNVIMNEIYAYGSEKRYLLFQRYKKDNMAFDANSADRDAYELIALYILLATQIKYDVTGIFVSPEKVV